MNENQSTEPKPSVKLTSSDKKNIQSKKKAEISNLQKVQLNISEPKSAQDLCEKLQSLSCHPKWDKSLADSFTQMVVNPKRQYQLDTKQKETLVNSILNCPEKYRALVHLWILSKDFISPSGLRTINGITSEIIDFIKGKLQLEPRIDGTLLKIQGDEVLLDWLKEKLINKEKSSAEKLDFVRNLIAYLVGAGESRAISTRLDIILTAFTNSNCLQQSPREAITLDKTIKSRVKAVSELFSLGKPSTDESQRLILFGSYSQVLAIQQMNEIDQLNENLQKEKKIRCDKEQEIEALKAHCQKLEEQLIGVKEALEHEQANLNHEKTLYEQLKTSSTAKISQQRNSVLNQMRSRIEHELQKLERCFTGKAESFHENSEIGLEIIDDIKKRLSE